MFVQSFNWSVSPGLKTTQGRIRVIVTDTNGFSTPDDSDTDFIILQGVTKVTHTYGYDKINRLTKIIHESGSQITYTYDAVGNRIALAASHSISKIGVFRNGSWYLDYNGNGFWNGCTTDKCYTFGLSTDKPVAGNW